MQHTSISSEWLKGGETHVHVYEHIVHKQYNKIMYYNYTKHTKSIAL